MNEIQILWQPVGEGARILRVFGEQQRALIPDAIGAFPVTEIGPYCFSSSEPRVEGDCRLFSSSGISGHTAPVLPLLGGNYVEEIILPQTTATLHNAAFYNCRNLRSLSVGASIKAIGSDEFTNCTRLDRLFFRRQGRGAPGLALILERIPTDLDVTFLTDGSPDGALFFPEYYEWLDEISPAHIFSRSIHGEGFRMRKAFQDNMLIDYHKYDSCFKNALKIESEDTLCHIALDRLCWPESLEDNFRFIYENTVLTYFGTAVSMAVSERNLRLLRFLFTYFHPGIPAYMAAMEQCIKADWGEAGAFLMEAKRSADSMRNKTFDFDEWEDL